MKALELFAGIGGFAAASNTTPVEVIAAIDASLHVLDVYRHNWPHLAIQKNLEGMTATELQAFGADLWWMSPPCQPHTIRGLKKDIDDPRSLSFSRIMEAVLLARPSRIGFENVEGFLGSQAHQTLRQTLDEAGYKVDEKILCPSMFGLPNRRPRFLLAAAQDFQPELLVPQNPPRQRLTDFLREPEDVLFLSETIVQKYGPSFHTVFEDDPDAVSAVFTSAYTKSWMYAGSFLHQSDGRLRAFSPREILNLLGFPESFALPNLGRRQAYKYVGNSLSIPTTRAVIDALLRNY